MSEERETTIYLCRYSNNVHRNKSQDLAFDRLTHSLYTTKIARSWTIVVDAGLTQEGSEWKKSRAFMSSSKRSTESAAGTMNFYKTVLKLGLIRTGSARQ